LDLERQLRVTEQRYRTLFERSAAGLFVASVDGTITDANATLATMLGGAVRDDVVGRRFTAFLADADDWDRLIERGRLTLRLHSDAALVSVTKAEAAPGRWCIEGVV